MLLSIRHHLESNVSSKLGNLEFSVYMKILYGCWRCTREIPSRNIQIIGIQDIWREISIFYLYNVSIAYVGYYILVVVTYKQAHTEIWYELASM